MEYSGKCVEVAQITGVHGVRGGVLMRIFTESEDLFRPGTEISLEHPRSGSARYVLASAVPHKGGILAVLDGVGDRETAQNLVGAMVLMDAARFPGLEDGEFYWHQLIGLDVFEKDGARLGVLESIIETGSNDVYVVMDGKKETLVPNLSWVVLSVDLAGKKMIVDLPEGL